MKRLKGFFCPNCRGQRLHVITVVRAAPSLIVRYRECVCCNQHRVRTEEREVQAETLNGKKPRQRKPTKKCATS